MARKQRSNAKLVNPSALSSGEATAQNPTNKKKNPSIEKKTPSERFAHLPPCRSGVIAEEEYRDEVIWTAPTDDYFENPENIQKVHHFVIEAVQTTGIGIDRALFNLRSHDYNIDEAKKVINSKRFYRPVPWTEDDVNVFRRVMEAYGKNFRKVREIIPHKSLREIVAHYYNTKSDECYKKIATEAFQMHLDEEETAITPQCPMCSEGTKNSKMLHSLGKIKQFCQICASYRDRVLNFEKGPKYYLDSHQALYCPEGMVKFVDIIVREKLNLQVFSNPLTKCQTEARLADERSFATIQQCTKLEDEIKNSAKEVDASLKEAGKLRSHNTTSARTFRARPTNEWTCEDIYMATSALCKYGLDFAAASAIVRTKSPAVIEEFYMKNKKMLDRKIKGIRDPVEEEVKETVASFNASLVISDS